MTLDVPLVAALLLCFAVLQVVPGRVAWRAGILLLADIAVLLFVTGLDVSSFGLIAGIAVAIGFPVCRSGEASTRPYLTSFVWVFPVLGVWALGKWASTQEATTLGFLGFVGFSYMLVKCWTSLRDVVDGRISRPTPLVFAAYLLHFPTFTAGPIHSLEEFQRSLSDWRPLGGHRIIDLLFRGSIGMVKIKILAPLLTPFSLIALIDPDQLADPALSLPRLLLGGFCFSIVLWADFSGYCDLAIVASRLLGIETPENFNYPFASRNIREFWQRWHISFSRVLTQHLFVPISRTLQSRMSARVVLIVSYLATFLFCGYWHGATMNFVAWGLYHAMGLIVADLFRTASMKRRLLRKKRGLPPSVLPARLSDALAIATTFTFVSVGWMFFVLPLDRLGSLV